MRLLIRAIGMALTLLLPASAVFSAGAPRTTSTVFANLLPAIRAAGCGAR